MPKKNQYLLIIIIIFIGAMLYGGWYLQNQNNSNVRTLEPVTISTSASLSNTLVQIADAKGFFARHGLNVTIITPQTSVTSLDSLVTGIADIAGASDYAFMSYLFLEPTLQVIATTAKADVISIVARRDRGIVSPQDLSGKTVGVTEKQAGEFFLGRYFVLNHINSSTVSVVHLLPAEMPGAIMNGTVDAVITWEPHVSTVKKMLGPDSIIFPAQEGQRYYWTLISTSATIKGRPETIRNLLAALVDAEYYTLNNPKESQQIIADRLNLDSAYVQDVWHKYHHIISLDQTLITAMEDEARWAIQNNLTHHLRILNYRNNMYLDALDSVKKEAVTIIR